MKEIITRFDEIISDKVNKKEWTMQLDKILSHCAPKDEQERLAKQINEQK